MPRKKKRTVQLAPVVIMGSLGKKKSGGKVTRGDIEHQKLRIGQKRSAAVRKKTKAARAKGRKKRRQL